MPTILDQPPAGVRDQAAVLDDAMDADPVQGGIPAKAPGSMLLATWNVREFGRFTPKWDATGNDSPKRDLRSLLMIARILERFDVVALQELQSYTNALREVLRWLNRDEPLRWRVVVTDVVRGKDGDNERLGYLFDSKRFDLDGLVGELVIPPEEIGAVTQERLHRQFAKTPYAVGLRSVHDDAVAFVLVTVHVVWGNDPSLRAAEANRLATWIAEWTGEPHVWDTDVFALGDFNADRVVNPDGSVNPVYQAFQQLLTIPDEMHAFPRTIFKAGQNKHYDMITWHVPERGRFGLEFSSCGFFDIDRVLRPGYGLNRQAFSFRVSDHYPMWARFEA